MNVPNACAVLGLFLSSICGHSARADSAYAVEFVEISILADLAVNFVDISILADETWYVSGECPAATTKTSVKVVEISLLADKQIKLVTSSYLADKKICIAKGSNLISRTHPKRPIIRSEECHAEQKEVFRRVQA